jgi:hypothetical protein
VLSITQTLFLFLREQFLGIPRTTVPPPAAPTPSSHADAAVTATDSVRAK